MPEIKLRPIKLHDLEQLYIWRNNLFIMARTRQWRMLTWKDHIDWFNNLDPNKNLMYGITANIPESKKWNCFELIGVCGLANIDWVNRSCELSIYIGGEKYRRHGYGSRAITRLKKICFDQMNMHRLWAEVYEFNTAMMELLKTCGFGDDGRLRETIFRDGKYYDSYFYTFLKGDWREEKGTKNLFQLKDDES